MNADELKAAEIAAMARALLPDWWDKIGTGFPYSCRPGTKEKLLADAMKQATIAHTAAAKVREGAGFVVVPKEPNSTMLDAARDWSIKKYGQGVGNDGATGCWRTMLAAHTQEGG